ncbi:cytochrome b6 [Desulfuromonas versatilis]|uniref:Cytochrome b6 n=1 Tax=Desulfuromonas versatilis TaxID=2802975 RepID=A0ABM8HZG0_9BACT|nr:selenite/tellurite reduction operon b-type cytochrome membrane protein ExtQ [Desulfuromonas versatilis]BCR06081.1 cytochrome b6 [Desulfuromonas versatilis]
MRGYVRSSPHFFRLIRRALLLVVSLLAALALVIPAPLQERADFSRVPNPSKSAWFLLWTQELVSHGNRLAYLVLALVLGFFLLPWLTGPRVEEGARWFPQEQKTLSRATLLIYLLILVLTLVAMFFRGANWAFVLPF